jgi:hypothetical protein
MVDRYLTCSCMIFRSISRLFKSLISYFLIHPSTQHLQLVHALRVLRNHVVFTHLTYWFMVMNLGICSCHHVFMFLQMRGRTRHSCHSKKHSRYQSNAWGSCSYATWTDRFLALLLSKTSVPERTRQSKSKIMSFVFNQSNELVSLVL